jgi:hypothetical protein
MTERRIAALVTALLLLAMPAGALAAELGAIAGAGLCFTFGSYLDAKAANLAEQGTIGSTPGSSQYRLFPGTSGGVYGQVSILSWLDVRMELRVSYLGASRVALMGDGTPFDAYGAGLYALLLPVLGRVSLPLGPGSITMDAGPYYGMVVGGVRIQDTYATTSTYAQIPLTLAQASMLGLSGGIGYQLRLGSGRLSTELRADWTILPVKLDGGTGSGDLAPLNTVLLVAWGFPLGGQT